MFFNTKRLTYMYLAPMLLMFGVAFCEPRSLVLAQNSSSDFSQCRDGRAIARCETLDCPRGDTNSDGKCTLDDSDAKRSDARNDAFCSNPASGCGQVNYFPSGQSNSCSVRVEEKGTNCDLYNAVTPVFTPTSTPKSTSSPLDTTVTCKELSVSVAEGTSPLKVTLTAGTTGKASEYEFVFGDSTDISKNRVVQPFPSITHTYAKAGNYTARVSVRGAGGDLVTSEGCKKTIVVKETGSGGVQSLPKTGFPLGIMLGVVSLASGFLGVYLFERYRTI